MKILLASDTFYPKIDGIVTYLLNLSRYLSRKGHSVIVICPEYDVAYSEVKVKNVKVIRLPSFSFPSYKEVRFAYPKLDVTEKAFKDFRPDLVHIHTPGPLGLMSLYYAKKYHVPVVNTYHTSIPDTAAYFSPKKLLRLDEIDLQEILSENFYNKYKKVQTKLKSVFERKKKKSSSSLIYDAIWKLINLMYNPSDLIISPSPSIEKELKKHKIKSRITVLSNGIELGKFRKKTKYRKEISFLHVGRLAFEKKIDVLISAMSKLVRSSPDAQLTIVGDGPAAEALKKQVEKLGLEKNILFTGYIKRDKLPAIYRKHDVFVTASEYETQGLVILEAMACGLPVIGVNVLAIPDVVHAGKTGFCAKRGNSLEISRYMQLMLENPALVKLLGEKARKEAELHDLSDSMRKIEEIYSSLVDVLKPKQQIRGNSK